MKAFSFRASLILHSLLHPHRPIYFPSASQSPHPLHSLPHFLSPSSPLFYLPPQLTHDRARTLALRAYTYARTYPHIRRFSFFSFTASPTLLNPLYINTLGVKENKKKPSQNAQYPYNQNINTKYPISSTVNSICHRGEAIYHHREHKNQKPSPLMLCETTICGIPVKR